MEPTKFRLYCMERGVKIGDADTDLLRRYRELANMTSKIGFGCDKCQRGEKRCCGSCSVYAGHMNAQLINESDVEVYSELFDKNDGFWTKSGCSLPRHMRSYICLTHYCYGKLQPWESKIKHELYDIINLMRGAD
jgi:hypothetical protein